jgi:hypothetical protein
MTELQQHFLDKLVEWQSERNQRPGFVRHPCAGRRGWRLGATIVAWALYELEQLRDEINLHRLVVGAEPIELFDVIEADVSCSGHIDYTRKLALRAVELVHRSDRGSST